MKQRFLPVIAGLVIVVALGAAARAADPPTVPSNKIDLSNVADEQSIAPYHDIGFTLTVTNSASFALSDVTLTDNLPAGGDLSWAVERQHGIGGCAAVGDVGAQSVSCPSLTLSPGSSYSLHVYSHTSSSTLATIENSTTVTFPSGAGASSRPASVTRTAVVAIQASGCRGSAQDSSRTLAFDDEFDAGTIDATRWTVGALPFSGLNGSTHYHNRQYGSYVLPENAKADDGVLDLIANNVPVTDPDVPSIGTIPYTEGMIHTKGKFSRTGGYFEICAKFPNGKGLWPAFWLASQNGNWPPEMDIAEWFGSLKALQIGQPFATGPNAGNMWQSTWLYSAAAATGWHDYAMWWTTTSPATIRYYIDGQMVHEIDGTTANLISNTPMYIILNSGTWAPASRGGPPDATTVFPNAFQVDYVRVYTSPPPQQTNSAP